MNTRGARWLVLAAWLAHVPVAHAGPVELFVQLALHPKNARVLALRYTNGGDGAFFSHDGGKSWQLACSSAADPTLRSASTFGVTKTGEVLLAGQRVDGDTYPQSLWQDDGHGCSFARVRGLERTGIRDIEADPSDDDVMYAVTTGFGTGARNGLMRRDAQGAWSRVGPQDEALSFEGLRLIKTQNGVRMYAVALRKTSGGDGGVDSYAPVIRLSDDGGVHWSEHTFEPPTPRTALELEAIDTQHPDTIVVSLRRPDSVGIAWQDSSDSVLVSDDQGATFRALITLAEVGGAVFTPDGRLWIGDAGNVYDMSAPYGLWRARDAGSKPERAGDYHVECLAYQPASDTLYACQPRSVGRVDVDSGRYQELMRAQTAHEFVSCNGVDLPTACEAQLCGAYCGAGHFAQAPLCAVYTGPYCGASVAASEGTLDAGARASDAGTDAGIDAGAPRVRLNRGCGTTRLDAASSGCGLLIAALLLLARRRPRRA